MCMELEITFNRLGGDPVEGDPVDIIVTRSLSPHSHLPSAFTSTGLAQVWPLLERAILH
jgi:hypothetical protein